MSDSFSTWKQTTVGEIVDLFDHVRVPLNSRQRGERQGEFPYYGASGIIDSVDDYLFDGEYVLVAEDGENLNSRKLPVAFMARGKFWVNNHAHILKGKPNVADDRYIISWFANANISGYITGAAQPKLSQANLKRISLTLPPYHLQRKIMAVLSAYEDLIENNTRRIAILEEMAQAIYREWFVNFKFPGHDNVKLVDSTLGKIPEGWEVVRFSDECQIVNGFAFKSKDYADNGTLIVRTKDFSSSKYINIADPIRLPDQLLDKHRKYSLEELDFLLIMVGASIGRFGIVFRKDLPALQNQNMWAIRPKSDSHFSRYYVIQTMSDLIDRVTNFATGAARDFYRKGFFYNQEILRPSKEVLSSFDVVISPITDLIGSILQKNQNLRSTRDLLLPKLISGQLDVEDVDIDVGEPLEEMDGATA